MNFNRAIHLVLTACLLSPGVYAQSDAGTDIYLAKLSTQSNTLSLSSLVNITDRKGYDNQPHFLPTGKQMMYTSAIENEGKTQMDAILYDLGDGNRKNLTSSKASEYSPTYMPEGDSFSVIRVGENGKQKFWSYSMTSEPPQELLKDVEPVGYHAWIDTHRVLLFVVGEPHQLQLADVSTGQSKVLDENIGPSLFQIPGTQLMSYTRSKASKEPESEQWDLISLNPQNNAQTRLTSLPEKAYYYTWTPDGKALAAQDSKLFFWDSKRHSSDEPWQQFADVSDQCPNGVSRLAVSPQQNKLAMVCNR